MTTKETVHRVICKSRKELTNTELLTKVWESELKDAGYSKASRFETFAKLLKDGELSSPSTVLRVNRQRDETQAKPLSGSWRGKADAAIRKLQGKVPPRSKVRK